ncbi:transglycosylase domain-containing protein [Lactobacillus sp. PV034]|uniref:transglycosylase domain-containing protein n=1 Tax=Lactobacillus sp. PV034 TaxID=2594495 RepID=UPI00223F4892|nr:transglycosylase domain-containing protein [Lactobacillus sp. PV034]QNQ81479.1 penicillin-binding protein [Lactobacillus sp. PV034]
MKNLKEKFINFLTAGPKVNELAQESDESKLSFYAGVTYLTLHRIFHYAFAILAFIIFLLVGFGSGYAVGIVRQPPIPTVSQLNRPINHAQSSATLYYSGNQKIAKVNSDIKVDKASDEEITPLIKKAVTATEDETFYEHKGVLPKSLVRAVISEFTGIGVQTGGSTLTQQLVKMQFLTSQTTWRRKITEMFYAHKLEQNFSKDTILRAYLNSAPYGKNNNGENINGIKTAAQGIFGKDLNDLTLPEVAFIAGLPQSPSVYTPYTVNGKLKSNISLGMRRKDIVLFRMYRNGDITKEQYESAKKYDLTKDFLKPGKAKKQKKQNSYLFNLVMNKSSEIIADDLIQQDGLNPSDVKKDTNQYNQYLANATQLLHEKGYTVHTTIRKPLYQAMQTAVKESNLGESHTSEDYDQSTNKYVNTTENVENGSVAIDNETGAVLAFSGGVDFKNSQINHAFDTYRSPGSSIKPYLVYAPAIEHKIISSQTAIADFPKNYGNYIPTDYNMTIENRFIPAQEALAKSYNLPAVNIYNKLLHTRGIDEQATMKKLGLNLSKSEYENLGLALGGTDYGFSVADNASAFSNFYNNGNRSSAYYIDEITDPTGRVLYKHHTKKTKVFSKGTTYIMQKMLHQVVASGTASSLKSSLQFSTKSLIGKTGTSNDYRDIWFNGATPGVTISSWIGYDNFYGHSYTLDTNSSETNLQLWANIANALYQEDPSIFNLSKKMPKPDSVYENRVVKKTGTLPGTVNFDGEDYRISGKKVTALSLSPAPEANSEFGIGASHKDYRLFYDYLDDMDNDYGKTLIYTGKTISKKRNLDDLFAVANGNPSNDEYYGKESNVNSKGSSTSERNIGANDQQANSGQGSSGNGNGNKSNDTSNAADASVSNNEAAPSTNADSAEAATENNQVSENNGQ